jgi:hypothetical protein
MLGSLFTYQVPFLTYCDFVIGLIFIKFSKVDYCIRLGLTGITVMNHRGIGICEKDHDHVVLILKALLKVGIFKFFAKNVEREKPKNGCFLCYVVLSPYN